MTPPDQDDRRNIRDRFRWSLQALAADPVIQRAQFPTHVPATEELALDFIHWCGAARDRLRGELSAERLDAVGAVARRLGAISRLGADFDERLWADVALADRPEWAEIRTLARRALNRLGWPADDPPLGRSLYTPGRADDRPGLSSAPGLPMPARQIRVIAIGIFRRDSEEILVVEGHDATNASAYFRPPGGGVEFGEAGAAALAREIREELGAEVADVRPLGALESRFTLDGRPHHEVVLVFAARFVDASLYDRPALDGVEGDGVPYRAVWRPLDSFGPDGPLCPAGLRGLLTGPPGSPTVLG